MNSSNGTGGPVIEMHHIHKTYTMGDIEVHALRGVSMNVKAGEFVAIMGASGSGKSTAMNILGCLDRPTKGTYILDGKDVSKLSKDARADIRTVDRLCLQGFNPVSERPRSKMSAAYAVRQHRRQRAPQEGEGCSAAGLAGRNNNRTARADSKRVAIARSLVNIRRSSSRTNRRAILTPEPRSR
jgi:putative ABC transport system ATP-binding protein